MMAYLRILHLKQCLENVGVGSLHACISSYENIYADKIIVDI